MKRGSIDSALDGEGLGRPARGVDEHVPSQPSAQGPEEPNLEVLADKVHLMVEKRVQRIVLPDQRTLTVIGDPLPEPLGGFQLSEGKLSPEICELLEGFESPQKAKGLVAGQRAGLSVKERIKQALKERGGTVG